jgi:hypothetical protein
MSGLSPCPLCGSLDGDTLYRVDAVPVHSCLLAGSRDDALTIPCGAIHLVRCEQCGHVANRAFEEERTFYSGSYEDSQAFSPTFVRYGTWLADRWVAAHRLVGGTVLEIGAGRGDFSRMLVGAGVGHVVAMDPTIVPDRAGDDLGGCIRWDARRFDAVTATEALDGVQAIVLRHVLEHVRNPRQLLDTLWVALRGRPDVPVLVEIPDAARVMREAAFWDVYYEHCAYFVPATARLLFEACGFDVAAVEHAFEGQYLLVTAFASDRRQPVPAPALGASDMAEVVALADRYARTVDDTVDYWRGVMRERVDQDVVLWGSGSKPTALVSALGDDAGPISRVVDVNPHKHGQYMLGSGLPIVPPTELTVHRPDLVVVMNPIYLDEITRDLATLAPGCDVMTMS